MRPLTVFVSVIVVAASACGQGSISKASLGQGGVQTNAACINPSLGAGGIVIAFASSATNLTPEGNNGTTDIYLRDRSLGTTTRLTFAVGGGEPNSGCSSPTISADGRYVCFESAASNLTTTPDTNGTVDVFLLDRQTNVLLLVSKNAAGVAGGGDSHLARLSASGTTIVFRSTAQLITADTTGFADVYRYDIPSGVLSLCSVASGGAQGNGHSGVPDVSADGASIVYQSAADNLVVGDTNNKTDCFLWLGGVTTRISTGAGGSQISDHTTAPSISGDGSKVAMRSAAFGYGLANGFDQVQVKTIATGAVATASVGTTGAAALCGSALGMLSYDGRYCVFSSCGTNVVPADLSANDDVFARDLMNGVTILLSASSGGTPGNGSSGLSRMAASPDTYAFCFRSSATNLVPFDQNGVEDLFVHDLSAIFGGIGSGAPIVGQPYGMRVRSPIFPGFGYLGACAFGVGQGFQAGAVTFPLDFDDLFLLSLGLPEVFSGFSGLLNASGEADLTLNTPAVPGLAGVTVWCCVGVLSADFTTPLAASNPVPLTFQ